MPRLRILLGMAAALCLALAACGDGNDDPAGPGDSGRDGGLDCDPCPGNEEVVDADCTCALTTTHMRLSADDPADDFYARPWPLDGRVAADGSLDLANFPHPEAAAFIANNLETIARSSAGFGTTAAMFMSFDAPADESTLPSSAADSLEQGASVFVVNIDPASDELGARVPIRCSYFADASDYNPANFVSCLPEQGFPLRPATLYGLYVTDALLSADGTPAAPSAVFESLRGAVTDAADADLHAVYAPLFAAEAALDLGGRRIVGGTAFTTQDPVAPMRAIAADVAARPAPELVGPLVTSSERANDPTDAGNFVVVEGHYVAPIYQRGEPPYSSDGGDIAFDGDGRPIVETTVDLRIVISLPTDAMPPGGWPVAMYHHGTGGDAASFVRAGTAHDAAAAGIAMVGIDAPIHGERNPTASDPMLLFFNIGNARAMRDNIRQGAADLLWLQRLLVTTDIAAADSPTGEAIAFDPERLLFMGHSQGGLTGPLMLAVADGIRGAVLSGAGGSITTTIVNKRVPVDIPTIARNLLALPANQELTLFHPALSLVQTFTEPADTSNFAPYIYRWRGGRGLHVWATQGLMDEYVPPVITDALVTSLGLQPAGDLTRDVEGLQLRGIEPIGLPASDNIEGVDGERYTGVYTQYPDDGHFAITQNATARAQLVHWLRTLGYEDTAELPAP